MGRPFAAIAILVALAGCASQPPHPESFTFAVIGDAPYGAREELEFDALLAALGAEPLAFVVHVGDIKGGDVPCTDELYRDRRTRLDATRHALVLTPGDNDWTDCRRRAAGNADPLERLARLREVFFADARSLGLRPMTLAVQGGCLEHSGEGCRCPGLPENRQWATGGVVFATIHVVGSNDNRGFDARNDAEQRCRAAANREWTAHAFALARQPGMRGLVIFAQANPWVHSRDGVYDPLLAQLVDGAKGLAKPLLFVHGDTHTFRFDRPFRDADARRIENAFRLETYGSPTVGWVRVRVDPASTDLFHVAPQLAAPDGG